MKDLTNEYFKMIRTGRRFFLRKNNIKITSFDIDPIYKTFKEKTNVLITVPLII